ncbi:thermonuclease family protein [Sporosarcina sp. ACRSL]|uniref:thermonuclease family protein n=1 Tax=Sporosarcina sp. ACRSL TaxID=2918215 RepID=UPI001EF4F5AC|nr:thermonuclease family protein [Sporosarcina sp. ACRSL]MCG7344184.1 thermonuclease family protein [Sporosarcina sp. ACRSL]
MKGLLSVLVVLLFIGLVIAFPVFFIGVAIAIWGGIKIRKNKELSRKSKMAPTLLVIGLLVALSGCVGSVDEEKTGEVAPTQQVEEETPEEESKPETETPKEEATAEESSKVEKDEAESETAQKNTAVIPPSGEKKPAASTAKPAPVKKTETSGTTAQVPVKLVKTIDGDTIKVLYNGKEMNVRYLLVDTPETNHPRLGKQPFGEEAKERNRQLVNSGELTLEFDIGERVDKYDRLLAYVYVDGKSVQKTLLAEGLARVAYVYPPNTRHLTPFEEAQAEAKKKGLGIWSVENYATDSGFNSDAVEKPKASSPAPTPKAPVATSKPSTPPSTNASGSKEWFKNCTELRKKYPNGVPEGHAAYQPKMDRDKDGYACER